MTLRDQLLKAGMSGRKIRRGEVYLVKDEVLLLPKTRLEPFEREEHEFRPVLILQCEADCEDVWHLEILVAPLSTRVDLKSRNDVEIPASESRLRSDSIAMLDLIQPILKTDLVGKPQGRIPKRRLQQAEAVLVIALGIIHRPST